MMVVKMLIMVTMLQTLKKMYMTQRQSQDPGIVVLLACVLDDDVDNDDDVADTEEDVHDPETTRTLTSWCRWHVYLMMVMMMMMMMIMMTMLQTLKKMYMTQKQNQDPGIVVLLGCILDDDDDDVDVDNGDDVADTEEDVHDPETEPGPRYRGVAGMYTWW